MAMPYDAERGGELRKMLVEARKRKLSEGLGARSIGLVLSAQMARSELLMLSAQWLAPSF